jgi:hypothetical protein
MRPPLDPSGEQLAELVKLRAEALALSQAASDLADQIRAVLGERVPKPPGRRKRHLRVVAGGGE